MGLEVLVFRTRGVSCGGDDLWVCCVLVTAMGNNPHTMVAT